MGFDEERRGYTHTIAELRPDGSAARAGLRVGDLVRVVAGRDVMVLTDLDALFRIYPVGRAVVVTILRGNSRLQLPVDIEAPSSP